MQQQICPPDQLGNQQAMSQQMVLCPVRVVYETQIFMQPGDPINPNQTFFINPHNPPPWAQNRPQNQVVYLQQVPNNIAPTMQQHMDQNQFYVQQNFGNYQISHPMLAQQDQMRSLQIANMVPSNMVQNCSNTPNERNVGQTFTYAHMANTGQNPIPSQANATPNNRQIVSNVGIATQTNQSAINPQLYAELQRQGAYMNVRPQMIQQHTNVVRPQIVPMNSLQNMQQQQTIGQTYIQNIGHGPVQTQNQTANMPRAVQPSANTMTNITKFREATPVPNTNPNTFISSVPNTRSVQTYTYKPIQPRPQYRQIPPNMPSLNAPTQPTPVPQIQSIPSTAYNPNNDIRFQKLPNLNTTSNYLNNIDKPLSRKRKSESPDELHAKMSAGIAKAVDNNNIKQKNTILKKVLTSTEVGVNTNPIHRIEHNIPNQNNSLPQTVRFVDNGQQTVHVEKTFIKPFNETSVPIKTQNDKDKLIRNTVYTQARGRLLNDKQNILNTDNVNVQEIQNTKSEKDQNSLENNSIENANETSLQTNTKCSDKKIENINEKNNNDNSKEEILQPVDKITFKQENDYILTHVLDGYVIQESNIAFPIRKPLKDKTPNLDNSDEQTSIKDENINEKLKDDVPRDNSKIIDLPLLPLYYLHLKNEHKKDEEKAEVKEDINKDKPFARLDQASVKSWTVDQLADYLTKHNWTETVSVLQEHEIDGESLFLVTRTQLVKIGISEEHADVICDFVKKH